MENKIRAKKILTILKKLYPQAKCSLIFRTPIQLVVATILSAQCTDERVNMVTKDLFKKYKTAKDFAKAKQPKLAHQIHSCGFFQNKSKNIIRCCQDIVKKHKSKIPKTIEEMTKLAGIGRKTANVVLCNAFKIPSGIAVDTHVIRMSNRLKFTKHSDPVKIEQDLMKIFPQKEWIMLPHYLIWHGRAICKAQNPQCKICKISIYCPARNSI